MKRWLALALFTGGLIDCSRIPFEPVPLVPLAGVDSRAAREAFAERMPSRMRLVATIVFDFRFHKMSALGFTEIDRNARTFAMVGMNAVGIKMIEITGDSTTEEAGFVIPELKKHGDPSHMIAEDIRRIYFDPAPAASAKVKTEADRFVYSQPDSAGTLTYVVGGADRRVLEKAYYENRRQVWKVNYYSYRMERAMLYPENVVLQNSRYHYRLIVRLKEIKF